MANEGRRIVLGNRKHPDAVLVKEEARWGIGIALLRHIQRMIGQAISPLAILLAGPLADRVFEPYFTTKEHGTGLGMALTYRIIIEHGGVVFAENGPEGGARVIIRLPLEAPPTHVTHDGEEAYG